MQWMNPIEAGGLAPTMRDMIDTWKELAWQDASTGWIGIANFPTTAITAAYLPDDGFEEVFTRHQHRITLAGQLFPNGTGERLDDGYRVTGAWQFGSGTGHSEYVAFGFMPTEGGTPIMADEVLPLMLVGVVPREQVDFTDGWYVQGLKGTGSYDYELHDVIVPARRTYPLFTTEPHRGGRLYTMGVMPVVAAGHASWALGVSRSALDDTMSLAATKTRMGDSSSLALKPTFQRNLAHHEAMWRAADLLVTDTFTRTAERVLAGTDLTLDMRASLRMAATYATEASRTITEWCHLATGTTAIREGSRLERAFRDMYTGSQHVFIGEKTYVDSAQVLLGLTDFVPGL
jgi:alkylation response protein AidB-like acyl-CoA dehydrogenase